MGKIIYITGGQRSGKSSFAQKMALELSETPIYLATSRIWDDEHHLRIKRHQSDRGENWLNIEEEKFISNHNFNHQVVLLDCITLWMTNYFFDNNSDIETSIKQAIAEFQKLIEQDFTLIAVSNEIGLGGTSESEIQRKFTDLLGWMNQFIAQQSDEAYFLVSGIAMKIK